MNQQAANASTAIGSPPQTAPTVAWWFLRIALAASFLSAVADRLGLWGPVGSGEVTWGNFDNFQSYTGLLLWYVPNVLIGPIAWTATWLEAVFAVGLLIGWRLRWFAFGSGLLLLSFAVSMTAATGIEGPLSYSVWTASAAAFVLASGWPVSPACSAEPGGTAMSN